MTEYQFNEANILIQPYASNVGPFTFDLSNQLATGRSVSSVLVKSYLEGTETTSELIQSSSVSTNVVGVYLNYPGATKHGTHKLTFEYTLDSGAKDEADFWGVEVINS